MNISDSKKTHYKGLIGEIEFTLYFLKKGWNIYKPIDQNSRVDLLIEKGNISRKVQIKYCTPYKGCLRVELEHPRKKTKPYSEDEIDDIGVFDSKNNNFYLIPLNHILPKKEIWMRVNKLRKKQTKNINWAEKYKI